VLITKVTKADGAVLYQRQHSEDRVLPESVVDAEVSVLEQVVRRGTGVNARIGRPVAGKTGTSERWNDAWFVGFTPELLTVVWVGFDDNTPINLAGSRAALPIWVDFMKGALAGVKTSSFTVPAANVVFTAIDPQTGLLASPSCPSTFSEAFIAGTEPQEYCSWHDAGGYDQAPRVDPPPSRPW
jgi:membrane carboxypeptidase/penicillin-binding protein